jgi:YHS domain
MRRAAQGLTLLLLAVLAPAGRPADIPPKPTAREALRPFNELIGKWRATGTPEGKLADKQKGLWEETSAWEWQFKDGDAWLKVTIEKGKYFTDGTLRYLPDQDQFQLTLSTTDQQTLTFVGPLKEHRLVAERQDEKTKETQRLVISLVGDNRYLYHYEVQAEGKSTSRKVWSVGATNQHKPLVAESDEVGPLCVVSYGPALSELTYKGKTYYVCCSSCRAEFRADPEKYVKEYDQMIAKLEKEKAEKKAKP